MITQNLLQELFDYKDGELSWKKSRGNAKAGQVAGHLNEKIGYYRLTLFKKVYMVHRIIFMYHNGYMPEIVDHADNNKLNNRIENLRQADRSKNMLNSKLHKTNISGVKNVHWSKSDKNWIVMVRKNKERKYLGSYKDLELADLVAQEARNLYQGAFARNF
jgi:hypothetical protein